MPMPDLEQRVAALEAIVAQFAEPEPAFMDRVQAETLHDAGHLKVRLTHEPTGIMVVARDRQEAVYKLRKALAGHARRQFDLQHAERQRQAKAAKEQP
jgi:predicted HD phosphohydrolase